MTEEVQSTPSAIEEANKAIDRLKRAKTAVHNETILITQEEARLTSHEKSLLYYQQSVAELRTRLIRRHKTLEFSLNYVATHQDDATTVDEMEKLAKKIDKMKKQLALMAKQVKPE